MYREETRHQEETPRKRNLPDWRDPDSGMRAARKPGGWGLVAILALGLATPPVAAATGPGGASWVVTTADDEEAARQLVVFLADHADHGLRVTKRNGFLVGVKKGDFTVVIEPKVTVGELDSLVLTNLIFLKKPPEPRSALETIVAELNRKTAGIQYSLESDGDLRYQVRITFVDRLDLEELAKAIDFMSGLRFATLVAAPELIEHLRR